MVQVFTATGSKLTTFRISEVHGLRCGRRRETFAGSTALGDADAYGILGRERIYLASRWVAPVPTNPNCLKLFTSYDGQHHGFGVVRISDRNNGDPNLFSSHAALNSSGTAMTLLVLNKDPANTDQVQFTVNRFTRSQATSYTPSSANPARIVASRTSAWSSSQSFATYFVTLLVIIGTSQCPGAEWDVNPDTTMLPAGGKVVLHPKLTSGAATATLSTPVADSGISLLVTQPNPGKGQNGSLTVTAGSTPGFSHYSRTGIRAVSRSSEADGFLWAILEQRRRN